MRQNLKQILKKVPIKCSMDTKFTTAVTLIDAFTITLNNTSTEKLSVTLYSIWLFKIDVGGDGE